MKLWKILGAAALAAGLAPYQVSKDEETGGIHATALLWKASYTPATGDAAKNVSVNVGLNLPHKEKADEAHIYSDDVTISYAVDDAAEAEKTEETPAEGSDAAEQEVQRIVAEAEAAEKAAEEAEAAVEAVEEKAEEPAEAAPAEEEAGEPAAEDKSEN